MESIDNSKMLIEAYFIGCLHGGNYKLDESEYTPIMKILALPLSCSIQSFKN